MQPPLPTQSDFHSLVDFFVSCKGLINLDVLSKSDPQCYVYVDKPPHPEMGRTEIIKDSLNPTFVKPFRMEYFFEEEQPLVFKVFDIDDFNNPDAPNGKELLGEARCTIAQVVGSMGQRIELPLRIPGDTRDCGRITITCEEVHETNDFLNFRLSGVKLDKKDFFGKSDPFFTLSRVREDGSFTSTYRSPELKKTLNPDWPIAHVAIQTLCNGDLDRPMKLDCYDWNRSGSHDFIGACQMSVRDLLAPNARFTLINPAKQKPNKAPKPSGTIVVQEANIVHEPSFLDYIAGGCELHFQVAIDYTASNRAPQDPRSLHHGSPQRPSPYARAIMSVGGILSAYNRANVYGAYGFGARFGGGVSHCFNLNGSNDNPWVTGVEGILQGYYQALQNTTLGAPTIFAQFLRRLQQTAPPCAQDNQHYTILLIITDGVITDLDATIREIVGLSFRPVSIIIVGVGNANFQQMNVLDADERPLSDGNRTMLRDIVQFVSFNSFEGTAALAKEVLAEVPSQLVEYMKRHSIRPNPKPQAPMMPVSPPGPAMMAPPVTMAPVAPVQQTPMPGQPGQPGQPGMMMMPQPQGQPGQPMQAGQPGMMGQPPMQAPGHMPVPVPVQAMANMQVSGQQPQSQQTTTTTTSSS